MKSYYVYIMSSSNNSAIYIGVTNNIRRRYQEHRQGINPGFTKHYHVNKLVYLEEYSEIKDAIAREKQLKGIKRIKKNAIINANNPEWDDLMSKELCN